MLTQALTSPTHDSESRLRIVNKTNLRFFYIGTDEILINRVTGSFYEGYTAGNLREAKEMIFSWPTDNLPDAVFVDVPLNSNELKQFCSLVKCAGNFQLVPIIYSLRQISRNKKSCLAQLKIISEAGCIDDVVDMNSDIDFHSKVAFLQELKKDQQQSVMATDKKCGRRFSFPFALKRGFDILIASIAILLLSPVFLLIALAIRIESKGPVFYKSLRAGKRFKIFSFYKFRSMVNNADKKVEALIHLNQYDNKEGGPKFFKVSDDPRITKLGKFLRNTSMDELPQLFNVLKGDMSLVGNRPLPLYEAETLTTNEFVERFNAPAGITGLWQVKKRGQQGEMSAEERIGLDIFYARNVNFLTDLGIIVRTPMALLQKTTV